MDTTNLGTLVSYLEGIAPLHLQEDYDNAGLITGHPDMVIKGVLVCLDAIEAVVDEAISLSCNVIIAHHPIVFRGLKRFNGANYIERTIIKAIKHDIAIYAIHTNLDNVYAHGVNGKIAERLGLTDTRILLPKEAVNYQGQSVGAGMIGVLPEVMSTMSFLSMVKTKMELQYIKHTAICKDVVRSVAVCGGSGGFLLAQAMRQGADIFITSDYKYHEFFDANDRIIIADIGHYESEKYTIELLYGLIINKFTTFAAHYTKVVTNPVKYF
jgi:dinuclear metal center YbgI/SA1388 family protein